MCDARRLGHVPGRGPAVIRWVCGDELFERGARFDAVGDPCPSVALRRESVWVGPGPGSDEGPPLGVSDLVVVDRFRNPIVGTGIGEGVAESAAGVADGGACSTDELDAVAVGAGETPTKGLGSPTPTTDAGGAREAAVEPDRVRRSPLSRARARRRMCQRRRDSSSRNAARPWPAPFVRLRVLFAD